ncbi:glycosyltransferase family 2 protein [Nodosilinea sp. AN01ver1]|uniref:glycosyltransferase family 2 protein n=1 Tax=Nodosilinea sp. AN01ver1 TaxID=3423362 RepID=UPI003D31A5F7
MPNSLGSKSQRLSGSTSPLVSVMVTSYNQKYVISRAIESVLCQTYNNIQVVVADDASTDGSQELLKSFSERHPGYFKLVFSESNQGIAKNKNNGFRNCDGEFITYLDGDDFYFPNKIEREINVFSRNPRVDVVYSNFVYADVDGKPIRVWKDENTRVPTGYIFVDVFSRSFPYRTLYRNELIKSNALKSFDYYDESLATYEDWDLRIRMSKKHFVAFSNYVGSAYVEDPHGISKVSAQTTLINDFRYVVNKNKILLTDFPFVKKMNILRRLEALVVRQELSLHSSSFIQHLLKYFLLTGDLRLIKRYFTKKFRSI